MAVPGIAVFWNHLPKNFASEPVPKRSLPKSEKTQIFRKDSSKSADSVAEFTQESVYPHLHESVPIDSDAVIQQVSWERSTEAPQNFESLVFHLKELGVTSYQLQKWGNRGELFRFSCYVTPSENDIYEKQFQKIGTDAVAVMRSVIAEIEQWKNGQ